MFEDAGSAIRDELQSESSCVEAEEGRSLVAIGSVLLWFPLSADYPWRGDSSTFYFKHTRFPCTLVCRPAQASPAFLLSLPTHH